MSQSPLRRMTKVVHHFEPTGMASAAGGCRVLVELECGHRKSIKNSERYRRVRFRCHECSGKD